LSKKNNKAKEKAVEKTDSKARKDGETCKPDAKQCLKGSECLVGKNQRWTCRKKEAQKNKVKHVGRGKKCAHPRVVCKKPLVCLSGYGKCVHVEKIQLGEKCLADIECDEGNCLDGKCLSVKKKAQQASPPSKKETPKKKENKPAKPCNPACEVLRKALEKTTQRRDQLLKAMRQLGCKQ
jgi:hypothetical protein